MTLNEYPSAFVDPICKCKMKSFFIIQNHDALLDANAFVLRIKTRSFIWPVMTLATFAIFLWQFFLLSTLMSFFIQCLRHYLILNYTITSLVWDRFTVELQNLEGWVGSWKTSTWILYSIFLILWSDGIFVPWDS